MNNSTKSTLEASAARSIASSIPRENVLRYSVVRQVLWGRFGRKDFGPYEARSGAGQDGVHKNSVKYNAWNPRKAKLSDNAGERGGAIMPGWWLVIPEKLARNEQPSYVASGAAPTGNSLRIVPFKLDATAGGSTRNSFYIHGTGGKGSDGCILLAPAHRETLVELVCKHSGAWLQAYVSGTELNEALERSDRFNVTS
jgi:hypothetical protein